MKTITWRKLMTVSGFLCLPLADASAAGQNWSITPSGTNEAGLYLLASGTNWESGNAPVGSGDRMRFANTSSGTNLYNNFDAGTRFSFLFEYAANHAYTFSGNSIELAGFTNSNGAGITQTFNLNMSIKDSVSVAGNGNFALTGTLTMNAASVILPTLTGTMSVGNLDLSTFQLRLGAALEKGANWTTYSNALSTVVIGNIVSGAGATFENHSLGQVILTGSNNLTGRITLGNQSFTEFRYTGTADRKLADGGGLYMYNGTLLLTGGTVTEQAGALTLGRSAGFGAGDTRIVRDSGSSSIMISTLSRTTYYTLNVSDNNLLGANTNVFGNTYHTAGFSGPVIANTWITVNARDWAVYDTETKYLRALTTEEYTPFATDLSNRDAYVLLNGSGTVSVADMQINTLKIDTTAGSGTLTADDRRITLYGGGLLLTGGNDYTISGGAIWGVFDTAPRYMLNIWNDSAGTLDLAADLTNIAHLVKSGSGTLILSGSNQFVTQDNQHVFTINSGTVILNHDYALNDGELNLNIGTGGLDLNGHSATVKSIDGQNNGQFTVTNSAEEIADLIVGDRDNKATGAIGLASAVITGNLRLVLQGDSNDNLTFINDNTNTGGMKIIGNTATRVGYLHYRFNKVSTFGTVDAPLELGDNGGFAVRDNWTNWTNPVIISGSNAFIVSEYANTLASNGVWSGAGDVELRNLALTLAAPLDEFSGTIKFSAAAANSTSKVTRVTSPIVQDSALATGSAATYALWRAADGGNDESTLNVTLQFKGAGTAYDVHIGDLVSFSQLTGSAAMKSGDNENSRGLVANNTANSTANLIVGSANHAYSEFAERIADSGTLDVNGAVTGVQSNAKVAVTKVGTGTWALTGSNTYSGSTTVSGGVLLLSGNGNLANTSAVTVSGGTLQLTDSGTIANPNNTAIEVTNGALLVDTAYPWTRTVSLNADGVLGGNGTIGTGELYFEDASAGVTGGGVGTTGTLTFGVAQSFWGDFTYYFDILSETVHDQLNFNGGLTFAENDQITLNVNNLGGLEQFDNVLIISGQLDNYDQATWQLDEGFSLKYLNNELLLSYSIPEPSTWLLLGAGATLLVFLRRRR